MTSTTLPPRSGNRFLFWLCLYVGIHFLVRLAMGGTLELDEAEQIVLGQELAWGYSTQPPLYTWLQWGLFQLLGQGVLALALLKAGLIFCIYYCIWQVGRRLIRADLLALLAAFTLLLIPSVAWESIRDLTHSVLATAIAAAVLYTVIRIYEKPTGVTYAVLGVLLALGMLAKYSFAVFALSLLLAALSLPGWRERLTDKRMLLTLAIAVLLVLPHLAWAIGHLQEITAFIDQQIAGSGPSGYGAGVIAGLSSLVKNIAEFVLLPLLVISLIFPQLYRRRAVAGNDLYRLVERFFMAALIVCLGLIVLLGTTQFQSRWFQPLLILLPLYLLARADGNAASAHRQKVLAGVLVLFAVLVIVLRFGQFWLAPYISDRPNRMQLPSGAIAGQVREAGFGSGTIIADNNLSGANLKLYFPDSRVLSAKSEFFNAAPRRSPGQCLIVWKATDNDLMPERLRRYLQGRGLTPLADLPVRYLEAPYQYSPFAQFKLAMVLIEDGTVCNDR